MDAYERRAAIHELIDHVHEQEEALRYSYRLMQRAAAFLPQMQARIRRGKRRLRDLDDLRARLH
jgi:phage shock protein A